MPNELFAPQLASYYRPHIPGVDSGSSSSSVLSSSANDFHNTSSTDYFTPEFQEIPSTSNYAVPEGLPESAEFNNVLNYWQGLMSSVGQQNSLNREYNAEQAELNRLFNSQEAEKARQWSERMSSSAYQRAVQDLQKAGLNPILAYQAGGASSPASNSASGQNASYNVGGGDTLTSLINAFSGIISSASDVISLFTGSAGSTTTRKIGFT